MVSDSSIWEVSRLMDRNIHEYETYLIICTFYNNSGH